jgi:hypothetical protein
MSIPALSSGWTEPFASPLLYCIFLVCLGPPSSLLFAPTFHVSHVHPPLTTRRHNTAMQVNNMGVWHLIYNGHIYITQYYYTISLLILLPHLGQAGWPRAFMPGTVTTCICTYYTSELLPWLATDNLHIFEWLSVVSTAANESILAPLSKQTESFHPPRDLGCFVLLPTPKARLGYY